jgi:hypothetical protein
MQQLDIFDDGRETMLANDLVAAIAAGDPVRAHRAMAALLAEFPDHAHRDAAALLVDALAAAEPVPFIDAAAAAAAREHLEDRLAPAALALLGREAAARWRAARLRVLGERSARVAWEPERARAHAASCFIAARAWAEALAAVQAIESWRRQPQPLAWAAEATWHHAGPDAGWPLVAESAWLSPARTPALLGALGEPRIVRLAARFEGDLDDDFGWFPAWLLVDQPLLAQPLDAAQPGRDSAPERAFKTLQGLLRLERQGRHHEVAEQRRRLRDLHGALFALYMSTR